MKLTAETTEYKLEGPKQGLANDALTDQITGSEAEGMVYQPSGKKLHPFTQETMQRLGEIIITPPMEAFETRSMPEIYATKNPDPSLLG